MKLAFIGLGNMGYPIAGHLAQQGHELTVYNRTTSKAQQWVQEYGHQLATTPQEAANRADIVFTCVGNDNDLSDVVLGEHGLIAGLKAGSILVDHSTVSAETSRELAALLTLRGVDFVDAPVSGGQQGAQKGQLSIMCGADAAVFARIEPVLAAYGKTITHMGNIGSGQLTKMVNQICVAGLIQALAEGIHFAQQSGLDVEKALNVVSHGAASSWQMVNRYPTMLADQYHHGFAVDWMRKDLAICLDEATKNGAQLPVTELVNQFYADVQALGGGRWDTSSLLRRLQKKSR
ncbi:MAG: NAD(P)-dependent oxidoreductase [Moraxellaceae bacterium]|nr:NAD(P)-dependent oxidoreductase [Moraxellaceae bacterium]